MEKKRVDRIRVKTPTRLDWKQILHYPTSQNLPEPTAPEPSREEDWLRAAVPQSIVNDGQFVFSEVESYGEAAEIGHSPPRRSGSWWWSIIWITALGICSGVGVAAMLWLTTLPPPPDCQNITALTADVERLYCAQEAARSGDPRKLIAGLQLVGGWSSDHPLYHEAQKLMAEWSTGLIAIARTAYNQGDMQKANQMIHQIPVSSPRYADARATIADWQKQWQQGQKIYTLAQTALKNQKWDEASAQIPALAQVNSPYWRQQRIDDLTHQILIEKQSWQHLLEARQHAQADSPEALGSALALAVQIDPKTYTWSKAKADVDRWVKAVVSMSWKRWQQHDRAGATAALEQIPVRLSLAPIAHEMLQYGRAQELVTRSASEWSPSLQQVWSLTEAVATIRQIQPKSPFYGQAQADLKNWQRQLQDLTQLEFADLTASVGQKFTLQLAIAQARHIATDRPRRLQAQTLAAHWGQEIQRIEDRPYVLQAQQLAKPGTIPALRAAIAAASQVRLGRALRREAQGLMAQWHSQIEIIEDQPILDEAWTLGRDGRLGRAIDVASKIGRDRALYGEAQAAIDEWQAEIRRIQIAQDLPILNEARALAEVDSLTLAIERASQIAPGRILYGEAQAEIADWKVRRQEIWDSWAAAPSQADDYYNNGYGDSYYGGSDTGSGDGYDQSY